MKRSPIVFLISISLLLFSLRLLDILYVGGMGFNTTFVDILHFSAYITCIVVATIIFFRYRKKTKKLSGQAEVFPIKAIKAFQSGFFPILFTITAVLIGAASVSIGCRVIDAVLAITSDNPDMLVLSIYPTQIHILLDFLSALSGMISMFWLLIVALWFLRGKGEIAVNSVFSLAIVVWFYSRALSSFLGRSINQHDTKTIISLFAVIALALGFAKFSRFIVFNFSVKDYPTCIATATFCLVWVVGLVAPEVVFAATKGHMLNSFLILADFSSAVSLFLFAANIDLRIDKGV